jgi:hypothetical protein
MVFEAKDEDVLLAPVKVEHEPLDPAASKLYRCSECERMMTDDRRMVCEGDDCTASLCLPCARIVNNGIYCSTCAEQAKKG